VWFADTHKKQMEIPSANQKVDNDENHGADPRTHKDAPDIRAQMAELLAEVGAWLCMSDSGSLPRNRSSGLGGLSRLSRSRRRSRTLAPECPPVPSRLPWHISTLFSLPHFF
jgi:hypothetical protein